MAKKQQITDMNNLPTELIITKLKFIEILKERINIGEEIYNRPINTQKDFQENKKDFSDWSDYNSEFLKQSFSKEFNEYKKSYDDAGMWSGMIVTRNQTANNELQKFKSRVESKVSNLKKLLSKTELLKCKVDELTTITPKTDMIKLDKTQVFIVHGHDEAAKTKTARFIEKLGLTPIILHEQASGSKTVIEKIEAYSNVGFGIVLYTPCDIGSKKEDNPNLKNRARQNVVFEHGFLIGKIGRENVCALVKDDIETPNDISGVVYVKMDDEDAWQIKLAKELRQSGYEIDMNKL